MRSYIAAVAFVASVNAYAYPAYNATSTPIYETPVYTATPIYETPVYTATPIYETPVYTTKVVTELTTVCPTPTEITYGTKTYTVTEATTLTITDCPCTVTEEVPSYPTKPAVTKSLSVPPPPAVTHNVPYPSKNVTVPVYPPHATGTGAPSSTGPSPPAFTGAAAQAGVGLLAVVGALAAFL